MHSYRHFLVFIMPLFLFQLACAPKEKTFSEKTIRAEDVITHLAAGNHIFLENKTIQGDLIFTAIQPIVQNKQTMRSFVSGSVVFSNCVFEGKVIGFHKKANIFYFSRFDKNLCFHSCQFNDSVFFQETIVLGDMEFPECRFQKTVSFEGSRVMQNANFREITYHDNALFQRMHILGNAGFIKNKFEKNAQFSQAYFGQTAHFGNLAVKKYADFSQTYFQKQAIFTYAQVEGTTDFTNAHFSQNLDLNKGLFKNEVIFKKIRVFGKTNIANSTFRLKPQLNRELIGKLDSTNVKIHL